MRPHRITRVEWIFVWLPKACPFRKIGSEVFAGSCCGRVEVIIPIDMTVERRI